MKVNGQLHPGEVATGTHWTRELVGPKAVSEAGVRRGT